MYHLQTKYYLQLFSKYAQPHGVSLHQFELTCKQMSRFDEQKYQ